MKWASALAPLLLQARIEDAMDDWYVDGISTDSKTEPAPGVPPISKFHLRGADFSLYFTVSNNTRDMNSVEIDIPKKAAKGMEIYDLSEFVTAKIWEPMERRRHVEMFPGQAHIMLVASPGRCAEWRATIAERLIDSDLRKMQFGIELAKAYNLDIGSIEADLELGHPPFAAIFALGAALELHQAIGIEAIESRVLHLSSRLEQVLEDAGLRLLPPDPTDLRSGIVYAEAEVDSVRLRNELLAMGVYVSARGDGIRCSTHFYNDETDLERLREALSSISRACHKEARGCD